MEKVYVIDAVNMLFRSYFAIGRMTNPKGLSTNALYGFIRSIYKLITEFSPTHLVAVFDGPDNKAMRTEIYKEYKSHRERMPEDLFPQLEKALEFCKIAGIPFLSIPGVEADDTMGTIALWAEKQQADVYLCSSDKDLCQMVSDHIFILQLHKENLLVNREKVKEIYGITPEQIVDYLAIVGDASDNIPGIPGFGPKTASKLLNEFQTLDAILAHPEKVEGEKKQQVIRENKEIALLSRQLATIHLGVEIPKDTEFYRLKEPHIEEVKAFYQEMHFMTLLKAMGESAPLVEEKKETFIETTYTLVDNEKDLALLLSKLEKAPEICIDTETTDIKPMQAKLVGVGFSIQAGEGWYVPTNGSLGKAKVLEMLQQLFRSSARFYGHNIKYDYHVLLNEGLKIPRISFDTMIGSYLLTPQNPRHNLDYLSLERCNKIKTPIEDLIGKGKHQLSMDQVEIDKVSQYCCEDTDYTCRLKTIFEKEIKEKNLSYVLESIELPLLPVLATMERRGIYVDVQKLNTLSVELAEQIHRLEEKIYAIAGEEFNISSPKQLSQILFEKLGIKPPKKTQTGYSTSADVLESLKETSPIIDLILEYRTLEKLRSTYSVALVEQVNPQTGRIHCTFNQSVAATGRLSCQDPNLQNIPIRSKLGIKIREAFEPELPYWSFLSADYSQIELRLLAHLSEDSELLKAFRENLDVHAYTASLVFNIPLEQVSSEMRHQAKAVNYGILYGQQAFGLSQSTGIDFGEASEFIKKYFARYKKVKEYLEFCKESARQTGKAFTLTGRQRPIPEINSKNGLFRATAERLAVNTPLQGTNADIIKLAMIEMQGYLDKDPQLGYMILQIHDELLFEVPNDQIDRLKTLVKKTMENTIQLKVPLVVDISIGKNWGEC